MLVLRNCFSGKAVVFLECTDHTGFYNLTIFSHKSEIQNHFLMRIPNVMPHNPVMISLQPKNETAKRVGWLMCEYLLLQLIQKLILSSFTENIKKALF